MSAPRSRRVRTIGAPCVLLLLAGCPAAPHPVPPAQPTPVGTPAGEPAPAESPVPAAAPRLLVVPASAARPATTAAVAFAETASTRAQRERGLMGRDHLETDHGMLFVYPRAERRTFWMKDCTAGLDIAFIAADGTIARIATLPPGAGLPDDRVPRADSGGPVQWVLEMEPGWFARAGLREGDRVDFSAAVAGIEAE